MIFEYTLLLGCTTIAEDDSVLGKDSKMDLRTALKTKGIWNHFCSMCYVDDDS